MNEKRSYLFIQLLSMLSVGLLFVVLIQQMKLSESQRVLLDANKANAEANDKIAYDWKILTNILNHKEARLEMLHTNGIWWSVDSDQSNVWITINATNEPAWTNTADGGKVVMKKLPGFFPPNELQ